MTNFSQDRIDAAAMDLCGIGPNRWAGMNMDAKAEPREIGLTHLNRIESLHRDNIKNAAEALKQFHDAATNRADKARLDWLEAALGQDLDGLTVRAAIDRMMEEDK